MHIFQLSKDFTFEAAHRLTKVPSCHQCGNIHGHSYKVRIHCEGTIDDTLGWVVDYATISAAVRPIIDKLDHSYLNNHFDFETTAENLAWWLCAVITPLLPQLSAVEVFETPTTSVTCKKPQL